MTAGNGPLPLGSVTVAEKLELLPWSVTFTVMPVRETVPLTDAGLPGLAPYTYFSASCRISSRRQVQSDTEVMRVPLSRVKGSGSWELEVRVLGRVTAQ